MQTDFEDRNVNISCQSALWSTEIANFGIHKYQRLPRKVSKLDGIASKLDGIASKLDGKPAS